MKQVYVIRHAPKDSAGNVSEEGFAQIKILKEKIGKFDIVISSDVPRAQQTTKLLTGIDPLVDKRASLAEFRGTEELLEERGETLVQLIRDTLVKLPENGKALIVSHDGSILAAEQILQNKPQVRIENNYKPFGGFKVDETLNPQAFSLEE